jgi:hypothetical protein
VSLPPMKRVAGLSRAIPVEVGRSPTEVVARAEPEDAATHIKGHEGESSGGETRTHNLAVNSRLLCH